MNAPCSNSAPDHPDGGVPLPLSQRLRSLLADADSAEGLTLNQMLVRTEGRGLLLLIVLLCLPFLTPVTIPGVSNVVGLVFMALGYRMALHRPPVLPDWAGQRPLHGGYRKVFGQCARILGWIERWVAKRHHFWLGWPATQTVHGLLVLFMGFILALPIPPVIPLSNTLPGWAIFLVALGAMEEDGWVTVAGYLVAALTVAYLIAWWEVIRGILLKVFAAGDCGWLAPV